jgi:ATP-dependent RNA helicase SUPV3L1/SUV3
MLSLAGATREQMGAMLLDMQCRIVGEEQSDDPEKPALQIFERVRRARPNARQNAEKSRGNRPANQNAKKGGGRSQTDRNDGKRRAGAKGNPRPAKPAAKQPDPNSPFAVLAGLKLKE